MKSIVKAVAITAGGIVVGYALVGGMVFGFITTIANDDPQED